HTGWTEHIAWRVPLDDGSHCSFTADMIHKTGADLERCLDVISANERALVGLEPPFSVVDRILKGEFHADDVPDRPDLVLIQDAVAMMSQGPRDREQDVLGASDKQVNLLRRIWTREIKAMQRNKPVKQWRVPRDLSCTTGVDAAA